MAVLPIVSVVGRPNVGKSSLCNRICGRRTAVVDDQPGVTRDRQYLSARWDALDFTITDTGGLMPGSDEPIAKEILVQVDIAAEESTVILFIVDASIPPTEIDLRIARRLKKTAAKKILLVANKAEAPGAALESSQYFALGLGEPFPVSALHGLGMGDMLDEVCRRIRASDKLEHVPFELIDASIAIVGRPNSGKSSFVNKMLGEHRMIVDDVAGTTRDSIDSKLEINGKKVILIDTAGLRRKGHVKERIEYYCNLRAIESIMRCSVVVLMIDAAEGVGQQDLKILALVRDHKKACIICLNKWDIVEKTHKTFDDLKAQLIAQYRELAHMPMISISALTGLRIKKVVDMVFEVQLRMRKRVPAAAFEDLLFSWSRVHTHPVIKSGELRILGAKQVGTNFPLFAVFATYADEALPSYGRYLENKIYEEYDFDGCPVVVEFKKIGKSKKPRVKG